MTKSALIVDNLVLRTATEEAEIDHLRQALNQGHYLKAGRPAGHVLWQGIYRTDTEADCPELVAVLCWGGAAKRLKERDNHIGWDSVTCANRLKLIVQLRRFYVIDSARRPNLASQCLALSLRTLGGEFESRHGFHPLLAESFHDPDEHTGTLYKATNWQPLGFTKGFKRHRRDFYQDAGKPKHLWVRPLKKDALALLARPGLLPPAHQAAIADGDTAGARCALKCPELSTLRHALQGLTDTLKSETSYFITSLEREERSASRLGQAIRGHWSVENKNHWKRDTSLWKEDASRPRKKASGGQVLALLRGAVLRLHDKEAFESLNASFHHHSARPYAGLRLLKTSPPQIN